MVNNQIISNKFLYDIKLEAELLKTYSNPVDRMLKRFEIGEGDYEKSSLASQVYQCLNWEGYYDYDIAIPLWKTLTSAMVECSSRKGLEIKNKDKLLYIMENGSIQYYVYNPDADFYSYEYLSKQNLGKKYSDKGTIHHEALVKVVRRYPQIETYCITSDSVANFMPCPAQPYNSAKGILGKSQDYFPLMIDYIQYEFDLIQSENKDNSDIICRTDNFVVMVKDIKDWHEWFIKNREICFLEEYYDIVEDELKQLTIRGIPLFKAQSLNAPLPKTKEDIEECLLNEIRITNNRASKMALSIKLRKFGKIIDGLFPNGGETYTLEELKNQFCDVGIDRDEFNAALENCLSEGWITDCGGGIYTR